MNQTPLSFVTDDNRNCVAFVLALVLMKFGQLVANETLKNAIARPINNFCRPLLIFRGKGYKSRREKNWIKK